MCSRYRVASIVAALCACMCASQYALYALLMCFSINVVANSNRIFNMQREALGAVNVFTP